MHVAVIGGGAAGCFAAIALKQRRPDAEVSVFESGKKILAKVAVTGGGRCNLTNSFAQVKSLESVYPRGHRLMKRLLKEFGPSDTCRWFTERGVRLVTQPDQCVFPASQDAMEIVRTLEHQMKCAGVNVFTSSRVSGISDRGAQSGAAGRYVLSFASSAYGRHTEDVHADAVLVASGGSPSGRGLSMLDSLGLEIIDPVPSLFSFDIGSGACFGDSGLHDRDMGLSALMGTVVEDVVAGLAGTGFRAEGPLLVTDWGMSGPAVLKLSSYAARYLAENGYRARMTVNWMGSMKSGEIVSVLSDFARTSPKKHLSNVCPDKFNSRLWSFLLSRAGLPPERTWAELGSRGMNRLAETLAGDMYPVTGRNRFKGEFVTCGGVSLSCIDPKTLCCRTHPGLYFAGEVLDVDAVTGGFNLQAAWTCAYVAAQAIAGCCHPSRP